MKFTGERFILNEIFGDIEVEHLHRYEVAKKFAAGLDVLDAASGAGYGSNILASVAKSVVGIDISEESVQYSQKNFQRENLRYEVASVEKIPLENNSVDLIVSFETIEHVPEDVQYKFLDEIKRVLRPNGKLIMSSPDKLTYSDLPHFNNEYHVHELYESEFRSLIEKYFVNAKFFTQGITEQRFDLIKSADSPFEKISLLTDFYVPKLSERYWLTVASDSEIGGLDELNSLHSFNASDIAYCQVFDNVHSGGGIYKFKNNPDGRRYFFGNIRPFGVRRSHKNYFYA